MKKTTRYLMLCVLLLTMLACSIQGGITVKVNGYINIVQTQRAPGPASLQVWGMR